MGNFLKRPGKRKTLEKFKMAAGQIKTMGELYTVFILKRNEFKCFYTKVDNKLLVDN